MPVHVVCPSCRPSIACRTIVRAGDACHERHVRSAGLAVFRRLPSSHGPGLPGARSSVPSCRSWSTSGPPCAARCRMMAPAFAEAAARDGPQCPFSSKVDTDAESDVSVQPRYPLDPHGGHVPRWPRGGPSGRRDDGAQSCAGWASTPIPTQRGVSAAYSLHRLRRTPRGGVPPEGRRAVQRHGGDAAPTRSQAVPSARPSPISSKA